MAVDRFVSPATRDDRHAFSVRDPDFVVLVGARHAMEVGRHDIVSVDGVDPASDQLAVWCSKTYRWDTPAV